MTEEETEFQKAWNQQQSPEEMNKTSPVDSKTTEESKTKKND